MNDDVSETILSIFEASLDAQLRAVRRLRQPKAACGPRRRKGLSQVDMASDILKKARSPLHVSQILERIQTHFGITVDRESLVSSLSKKVARGDRFLRPEKNTFAVRPEARWGCLRSFSPLFRTCAVCFPNRAPFCDRGGQGWALSSACVCAA